MTTAKSFGQSGFLMDSVSMIGVLVLTMASFLFLSAWLATRGDAEKTEANRYYNLHILAAFQTLERGVVAVPIAGTNSSESEAATTPSSVKCGKNWTETVATRLDDDLSRLDRLLRQISVGEARPMSTDVRLDRTKWIAAVDERVGRPIRDPNGRETSLHLECSDVIAAMEILGNDDGRLLSRLAWRDTTPKSERSTWSGDQVVGIPPRSAVRDNPWQGVAGCVYLQDQATPQRVSYVAGGRRRPVCELPSMHGRSGSDRQEPLFQPIGQGRPRSDRLDDPAWRVPPNLGDMLQPLNALRIPTSERYRRLTEPAYPKRQAPSPFYGENRIKEDRLDSPVGFSLDLTIDAETQAVAQQIATCYTGNQETCRALGLVGGKAGQRIVGEGMLEGAAVRMAGVAVIDIASGRIEALAGAFSPCARQLNNGPALGPECDKRLPFKPRFRPDMLKNPAVFADAMPGSTIKPIMAAGFLGDPVYGHSLRSQVRSSGALSPMQFELKTSKSELFLDHFFCADQGFKNCHRPWSVQAAATKLGWNVDCDQRPELCGRYDLLFGRRLSSASKQADLPSLPVLYGRLMEQSLGDDPTRFEPISPSDIADDDARRCSRGHWKRANCRGGSFWNLVSEGWGQGNARTTAVGAAGMLAHVAAVANDAKAPALPHLVSGVRGVHGNLDVGPKGRDGASVGLTQSDARIILGGLTHSHRKDGTASQACQRVLGVADCEKADWLAGKTGTPGFRNDKRNLADLDRICNQGDASSKLKKAVCDNIRPYKWYIGIYKTGRGEAWGKAIAVLAERNWQTNGRLSGIGDTSGPNPAAEIAIRIAKMTRQRETKP